MTVAVDANIAIAALNPQDLFHRVALRACIQADRVLILNITRAEALIYPTRANKFAEADELLDDLGFETVALTNEIADHMRLLRSSYDNKHFPLVDAAVVALGIERNLRVLTLDGKWPKINEVDIEVLA